MEVCAIVASLNVNRFCSFSTSTSSTASGPAEHLASSARLVLPLLLARRPCRERGWGQTEDLALAWCLCGVSEVQVQQEQQQQLQRLPANPKAKLFLATRLVTAKTACFYYSCLTHPPCNCYSKILFGSGAQRRIAACGCSTAAAEEAAALAETLKPNPEYRIGKLCEALQTRRKLA